MMNKTILQVLKVLIGVFLILMLWGFQIDGYGIYKPVVNTFTLYHFVAGLALGMIALKPRWVIVLVVAWEIIEQLVLVPLGLCYPPELLLDSILDMIVALLGYAIVRWIVR